MHAFRDGKNHPWEVSITVGSVKAVRGALNIDLYGLIDNGAKGLSELLGDPVKLIDVLYVLCREQVEKCTMTDEEFGRCFSGDSLEEAANAFVGEIIDFFPNQQARASLQTIIVKAKALSVKLLNRADQKIAEIDLEHLAEEMVETLTASSGNARASSESIPVLSP